jgi:hypothetical protein
VAVETEPGLEPEGVAGAEPNGRNLVLAEKQFGDTDRIGIGHRYLEAVLAGVARARDGERAAVDHERSRAHEVELLGARRETGHDCHGRRALERQQRAVRQFFEFA